MIRENSGKKEASFMPSNPWFIKRKLRWFWSKGRISEKRRKFKIFKLVNFKNRHLRPVKIYCREKTQLVHKLFFFYCHYYHIDWIKTLIPAYFDKQKNKTTLLRINNVHLLYYLCWYNWKISSTRKRYFVCI